ncbi:hypothetical protein GCWU000325_01333 [Alloprevotella tannerae ATCC 51259]|uniref:Uncharacterized protein n=1 Tax=Alloprevotella tannerae ATCC 51259 TaxID=626522 RepID=C9LGJ0_9BACT|nr:hypothetical protein GCWU000325_01333 [Alloprevotella tannerae ATCC 51259]
MFIILSLLGCLLFIFYQEAIVLSLKPSSSGLSLLQLKGKGEEIPVSFPLPFVLPSRSGSRK